MNKFIHPSAMMVKLLRIINDDARITAFLHSRTGRHFTKRPAKIIYDRPAILILIMTVKWY